MVFGSNEPGELFKLEKEQLTGSFEVYNTCKYRDLCLRYLGENPIQWADISSTPCPCNEQYFREVCAYSRIISNEDNGSRLPYSRMQLVRWMTEKEKKGKTVKRRKEITLTQTRLQI